MLNLELKMFFYWNATSIVIPYLAFPHTHTHSKEENLSSKFELIGKGYENWKGKRFRFLLYNYEIKGFSIKFIHFVV